MTLGTTFISLIASLAYKLYVTEVASLRSTIGTFVAILVLTAYLNVTAIVFLAGVQADELIRKDAVRGERGVFDHLRAALGQPS